MLLAWPARPEAAAVSPPAPLPHSSAPQSHRVVAAIPLGLGIGQGEQTAAFNPVNGLVYVANSDSDDVSIISGTDVTTMAIVGDNPDDVAANPLTGRVYVGNVGDHSVSVLESTLPYHLCLPLVTRRP